MGYDLKPMRPSRDYPRIDGGDPVWGRYNIWGWPRLIEFLEQNGVDTKAFPYMNDGELIPAKKCREVAECIEKNRDSYPFQAHLEGDLREWKNCGGFRVY